MKLIQIVVLMVIVAGGLLAQDLELVRVFPDRQPFHFGTTWDGNEGVAPGPWSLRFIDDLHAVAVDSTTGRYLFFDKDWNTFAEYYEGFGTRFIGLGSSYLLLSSSHEPWAALVFDRHDLKKKPLEITLPQRWARFTPMISGNYLLFPDWQTGVHSWEIAPDMRSYTHHNAAVTGTLLADSLGQRLGVTATGTGRLLFHSRMWVPGELDPHPVMEYSFDGFDYDLEEYASFEFNTPYPKMRFLGTDAKGLYYFWHPSPSLLRDDLVAFAHNPVRWERSVANPEARLVFAIADPWQRRIIFRTVAPGSWTPVLSERGGIAGSFPFAVHPNGSVYLFDGDEESRSYRLQRFPNTWWADLGFDRQEVGTVTANRVRIRQTPDTGGKILGHVYEMEHALILERSARQETIGGRTSYWYRIKMWDRREGWVFGAFLDIR